MRDLKDKMQQVCLHCHAPNDVNAFYEQYDDFIVNYNEKFAKPGTKIMASLKDNGLTTRPIGIPPADPSPKDPEAR